MSRIEPLETRALLSVSVGLSEELSELNRQNLVATVLPPVAANWIPQGPGPTQNGQVENILPNNEVVGAVHVVAAHPTNADILYLGSTNGGVWRTNNATQVTPAWTPLTDEMPSLSIGALEFDSTDPTSQTLVAGIGRFSSFLRSGGDRTGLLRTTDGGQTWSVLDGAGVLNGKNISGVAGRGSTIVTSVNFADTFTLANVGIFRSTDSGATFSQVSGAAGSGLPNGRVFDLVGDPTNPAILYAPVRDADTANGIYKSTDTGANWSRVSDAAIDALILDPGGSNPVTQNVELAVGLSNNVYAAIINDGQLAAVFRSGDGGGSWALMDLPVTNEVGGDVGTNPRRKPGELPGSQGQIHFSIVADPTDANIVYVGGDRQPAGFDDAAGFPNSIGANDFSGRLFRGDASLPSGSQWVHLTHSNALGATGGGTASSSAPHADSREMVFDANGNIIEGDDGGIYRRTNPRSNSGDWFSVIGNLQTTEFHDIAYDANANVIIGGAQDTGTPQQLSPGSSVWNSVSVADGGDVVVDDTSTPGQSIRYSSFQNLGQFTRRTYDSGNNLLQTTPIALQEVGATGTLFPQFVTPLALNEIDPTRLIIGGSFSTWESLDQGNTITDIGIGISVNSLTANPIAYGGRLAGIPNPDVLYVGSGSSVFLRTVSGGQLAPTPAPFPGSLVVDIVLDDKAWTTAYVVDSNDQVFQTADAGASWTNITADLGTVTNGFQSLEFVPGVIDNALVVGTSVGVYVALTSNLGTWAELGPNLPNVPVWDLDYDAVDDVLVAGTLGRGAWLLNSVSTSLTNTPPVAVNDSVSLDEDFQIAINVLANDTDSDGFLNPASVTVVTPTLNGTVSVNPITGQITYTPSVNFFGNDLFTYTVADNAGAVSNIATVDITVNSVNDPPVAVNDLAVTDVNAPVLIDLLSNDFDPDGPSGTLRVQVLTQPLNGTALVDFGTQRVMYTPNPEFAGADVFTYRVVDGEGAWSNPAQVMIRSGAPVGFTGAVFADRDNDGRFDADELGIPGVTITFTKNDGPVVFSVSTQTVADGSYSLFESLSSGFILPAGVYSITQQQPTAFIDGADTVGSPFPAAVLNDVFHNISLGPGQLASGFLFGERGLNASFIAQHPELTRFFASTVPDSSTGFFGPLFVSPGDAVGTVSDAGFSLRTSNNVVPTGLPSFNFGLPQWHPISGDWNGDGIDTVGAYNSDTATFFLTDTNEGGAANHPAFNYGIPGWVPLAGDWNGDGIDTIGVYNPATATFFLRNYNTTGVADVPAFNYGLQDWVPLAGNWEGLGIDTIGAYNPDTATYFLRYTNDSGTADVAPFNYGMPHWQPVTGDWNDDGIETAGTFNPATATFFLRNSNSPGVGEVVFNHGTPGSAALVGHWMPIAGQTLLLDGTSGPVKAGDLQLTTEDVIPLLTDAVRNWTAAGLDIAGASILAGVDIHITDLPGRQLGLATEGRIYLDQNAAGQGWFVDLTPTDDTEFTEETAAGWLADHQSPAAAGVDLLTVLTHELGHILGLDDHDVDTHDIMYESLATGTRRGPDAAAVDRLFAD